MPDLLPISRYTKFVPFTSTDLVAAFSKVMLIAFLLINLEVRKRPNSRILAQTAGDDVVHHFVHGHGVRCAELRLKLGLRPIPSRPPQSDSLQASLGYRDQSNAPVLRADLDLDQAIAFNEAKVMADRGTVHGHKLCQLEHRLRPTILEMAQDRILGDT